MANIDTPDNWAAGIYQWADGDVLDGGADSLEVLPVKQLASRSLYQRLRNVTPWDAALAAATGYPASACVRHAGTSWRAKLDNSVAPGTDAAKWERWGWSEDELNAKLATLLPYGAPVACPNAGPGGAADKTKVHKSALGEYWFWLGDAWRVVAGQFQAAQTSTAGLNTNYVDMTAVTTFSCHRAGTVLMTVSGQSYGQSSGSWFGVGLGLPTGVSMTDLSIHPTAPAWHHSSATEFLTVAAGDVQTVYYSGGGTRSNTTLRSRLTYID
jgi:hypothetical protein